MEKIKQLAISDSGFIFDPSTGNSFTTNESGLYLLRLLSQGSAVEDLAEELVSEFEVELQEASHDISNLLDELQRLHLV